MNKTTLITIASLLPCVSAAVATAQPLQYTIQEMEALDSNDPLLNTNATGMNELGHVAGISDSNGPDSAYNSIIWVDGLIDTIVPVIQGDQKFPWAKGINIHGQIVGQGTEPWRPGGGNQGVPMTWTAQGGMWNPDPNETSRAGWSWAINDAGQIGFDVSGALAIMDPVDGIREFGLGGSAWSLWEINNSGIACGASYPADNSYLHAYRYDYDTDTITDLADTPRIDSHSDAYGLNDNGDIAGWAYLTDSFGQSPIVWAADGRMIELATGDLGPAHLLAKAEHMNNHGTVVGSDGSVGSEPPIGWVAYDVLGVGIADVTTQGAGVGDLGFGVPDLEVTASDINYYINAWIGGGLAIADLTTTGAGVGTPGYGVPDGEITGADINFYVNAWVTGPVVATKYNLMERLSAADQLLWTKLHPFEVNEAGQICGTGIIDGRTRGFLMTPVPGN